MPNWEQMANQMTVPFGGVTNAYAGTVREPTAIDPVMVWNAMKAVGEYFKNAVTQPIQGTMDAARMGEYNLAPGEQYNPVNPMLATIQGIGAGWKGGLPAGETGVGMTTKGPLYEQYLAKMKAEGRKPTLTEKDFAKVEAPVGDLLSSIRSLQRPGQERALVSISELRAKSGLPPELFDKQLLQLAQEGKVALHHHDFAASLKPEERAKLLAVPNKNAYWGGHDYFVGVVPK